MRAFAPHFRSIALALGLILALFAATWAPGAFAQADGGLVASQRTAIETLVARIEAAAQRVVRNAQDDSVLVEIRFELEQVARELIAAGVRFRPRLAEINSRLEELGAPPGEGQPLEPGIVSQERQNLASEKAEINALLGVAESASLRVNRLIDEIAQMRRDLFTNTLSKRYEINFALFGEVVREFGREFSRLQRTVTAWAGFVLAFKLTAVLIATFLAVLAAAVLLIGGRRLFGAYVRIDPGNEEPSYLARLTVAFWSTLLPAATLALFLALTYSFYSTYSVLRPDIARMMASLFTVISVVYFIDRLARAALAPDHPNWRLLPVRTGAARKLVWLITLTAIVNGLDYFLATVNEVQRAALSLTVGNSLAATVLVGLLVILIGLLKPFRTETGEARPWPSAIRALIFLVGGTTIVAALLGYIGLARFISQQIVVTGAILATIYIGFLSASAISEEGAFPETRPGRFLARRFGFDDRALDQAGLAISILLYLLTIAIGTPLILLQWGFHWGDIQSWGYRLATGITIGSISISLVGILGGLIVFVIGFFVTRWFQNWLDGKVMARGRVDPGVRNSIRMGVGYTGVVLAALLGISAAGFDLSNFALVAGALSLGIGFGLQNIVSNFVSGLILLAERPFKVGDWVVAGQTSGIVKKISVRATEIETFQRQTVILPNSDLINSPVANWTHKNRMGRVEVPIGVSYDCDARRVHELLTEIARGHPAALKNPEPFVAFTGFGDSSLNFEVRLFVADYGASLGMVSNDIRFSVLEAFAREGIEIPFPQSDVHVRSLPAAEAAAPEIAQARPEGSDGKQRRRRRKIDPE